MARPRLLFLETLTELLVLDLAKKPVKNDRELEDSALTIVKSVLEIKAKLSEYRREQIESGKTFEDEKFSDIDYRADRSLIRDLTQVRDKLFNAGLSGEKLKYAHSLIGKSIFIRYLEDRKILSKNYFLQIASSKPAWQKLLESEPQVSYAEAGMAKIIYPKLLANKSFTYALFEQIATDFNGDIFPTDDLEKQTVTQEHLTIVKNFLDGNDGNPQLFFWAYKFEIIPIELISNIYEEFYHFGENALGNKDQSSKPDAKGTYYTPAPLVEFILSRTLTVDVLNRRPRVLDPSCGSGIFLVEAYRRMVRYELFVKKKKRLTYLELLKILENQIAGIELNDEAIKVTAFSLYLAFLHYQTPPDILVQIENGKRLPHLIYTSNPKSDEVYFNILLQSNAFDTQNIPSGEIVHKFGSNCADVIVGNPPWGSPPKTDEDGRRALQIAMDWCNEKSLPTSDLERSQLFIWRAIDLLRENGIASMLVSSGVLLKQSDKSNIFKQEWLHSISLKEVVNFIHVRDVFFSGAISPFISITFTKTIPESNCFIDYLTARRTKIIENTKSVILDKTDFKFFSYSEISTTDIWKIFYFGNHRDLSLINRLRLFPALSTLEFIPEIGQPRRQGFIVGNEKLDSDWLCEYKELPAKYFESRYKKIQFSKVLTSVPLKVKERGVKYIYEGERLLVGKIAQKTVPKGQLVVRLESKKFAFRNTINCIKLSSDKTKYYKLILGILWSSLSRYYFFMTASKWGVWHDQVYLDEILGLPISLMDNSLSLKIASVVEQLSNKEFQQPRGDGDLFSPVVQKVQYVKTQQQLEKELDEYVFKLYKISESDKDLIRDRCKYDIDFFYNDSKSIAVSKLNQVVSETGDLQSLHSKRLLQKGINRYLHTFMTLWTEELEGVNKLTYRVIYPNNSPLLAVVFEVKRRNAKVYPISSIEDEWRHVLNLIDVEMNYNYSKKIYVDGIVRITTDDQIIIIKRNEQRLWTGTAAREDVDATILQNIMKQQ